MSNETNQSSDNVEYFVVKAATYRAIIQKLSHLPYRQVRDLMMDVEHDSRAIFKGEDKAEVPEKTEEQTPK